MLKTPNALVIGGAFWTPNALVIGNISQDDNSPKIEASYDFTQLSALPSDFSLSRLSKATYLKDGELKDAEIDEPRFEKEGLLIERGSVNRVFPSCDWVNKTNLPRYSLNESFDEEYSFTSTKAVEFKATPSQNKPEFSVFKLNQAYTVTDIQTISVYAINLEDTTDVFYSGATRMSNREHKNIHNQLELISKTTKQRMQSNGEMGIWIYRKTPNRDKLNFTIMGFQIEDTGYPTSLIKTSNSSVARSPDNLKFTSSKPQTIKITYKRQDSNTVQSQLLDMVLGVNPVTLDVGFLLQQCTVFNRILTAQEKENV